jgi:hypothetical protein
LGFGICISIQAKIYRQGGKTMKKIVFLSMIAVIMVSAILFGFRAAPAAAGTPTLLEFNTMVGVPRPYTGTVNAIRGISGGGFPWVISSANGELKADGKIEVKVKGLVIDPNDPDAVTAGVAGKNPLPSFKAIVSCLSKDADGAPTTVNVPTKTFPASSNGNASIEDTIALPHPCIAPIVFVTSPTGAWFAATGNP